jgi:acetyltransferase-like isoleucine patch superfamily enzyme
MRPISAKRIYSLIVRITNWRRRTAEKLQDEIKRESCEAHNTARLFPESSIINLMKSRDCIQIGAQTISRGECRVFGLSGKIKIGSYCYVGDHTKIWSAIGITIGDRVLIAHSVNIHDNDSHPTSGARRHAQTVEICTVGKYDMTDVGMAPIVIEDDAWIGFNSSILKGVKVGKGAIIGASTVITTDVPPYAIMVGNPARQIGTASE